MRRTFKVGDRVVWARDPNSLDQREGIVPTPAVGELGEVERITAKGQVIVRWPSAPYPWYHTAGNSLDCIDLYTASPKASTGAAQPRDKNSTAGDDVKNRSVSVHIPRIACLSPGSCPTCAGPVPCDYGHS